VGIAIRKDEVDSRKDFLRKHNRSRDSISIQGALSRDVVSAN
jgi:hypothetical protein